MKYDIKEYFEPCSAACIRRRICSKNSNGYTADRDGKRFEDILAEVLRKKDRTDSEEEILLHICNACGIDPDDIKTATSSKSKICKKKNKTKVKTDVLITSKNGKHIGLSLKNTGSSIVGVLETSTDAFIKGMKIRQIEVKEALSIYKKCRFRYTQFKNEYAEEYATLENYFEKNKTRLLRGLITGFPNNNYTEPEYLVFYDKKRSEILCISVDVYIKIAIREHHNQFECPFNITRASGHSPEEPYIKFKIYNPIRDYYHFA